MSVSLCLGVLVMKEYVPVVCIQPVPKVSSPNLAQLHYCIPWCSPWQQGGAQTPGGRGHLPLYPAAHREWLVLDCEGGRSGKSENRERWEE